MRALKGGGFLLSRQSGSHKIYKNKEGKRVTIPYHTGKILHPKVLKNILKDADLTIEELKKLIG
ncbi:MAG TPA: type II toxin-antitoxin system HicA family toxin [Candidatus Hypogeohydataceae bacterium YC41]